MKSTAGYITASVLSPEDWKGVEPGGTKKYQGDSRQRIAWESNFFHVYMNSCAHLSYVWVDLNVNSTHGLRELNDGISHCPRPWLAVCETCRTNLKSTAKDLRTKLTLRPQPKRSLVKTYDWNPIKLIAVKPNILTCSVRFQLDPETQHNIQHVHNVARMTHYTENLENLNLYRKRKSEMT